MRNLHLSLRTITLLLVAVFAFKTTKACDRSNLTLTSINVTPSGEYELGLRFCVGAGRTSTTFGADQDTYNFAFFVSDNASFVSYPTPIISPQTNAVYIDTLVPSHDTLVYYSENYWTGVPQPWACISNGCGGIQTVCYDFVIVTDVLPDSIWVRGAEGAGNILAGCTGTDMTVYPASGLCNISLGATVTQPTCTNATGSISLNPTGGMSPYTYKWDNGSSSANLSNLTPGTYAVTVTDVQGVCTSTGSFTITAATPVTANLGADKTVYRGYSPQSCTSLTPTVTGAVGAKTYLWSNGATTASINVCPTVTTTYTVTVTDSRGCSGTDAIVVNVVDVRCGSSNNKVLLCHSGSTLCVNQNQVAAHLAHGDRLGSCTNKEASAMSTQPTLEFTLTAYPVPASTELTLRIQSPDAGTATIEVYDLKGQRVFAKEGIGTEAGSTQDIEISVAEWANGMYVARVTHNVNGLQSLRFTVTR
ncbi:MAG: T9SS type A sorting domain-containing protein [Bacteroidia bacterium]